MEIKKELFIYLFRQMPHREGTRKMFQTCFDIDRLNIFSSAGIISRISSKQEVSAFYAIVKREKSIHLCTIVMIQKA